MVWIIFYVYYTGNYQVPLKMKPKLAGMICSPILIEERLPVKRPILVFKRAENIKVRVVYVEKLLRKTAKVTVIK